MTRKLHDLIQLGNENFGFEYKSWMNTDDPLAKAKLARHLAALSNHGGGYLIFGIEDKTREPQGATDIPMSMYGQDAISSIAKRYLDPAPQVTIEIAEHDGVKYPVIVVPSHGSRPVIAIADGPHDGNKGAQGVRKGEIYIRRVGPSSELATTADDWNSLLERCLSKRADLLGSVFRQSIDRNANPSVSALSTLSEAMEQTNSDFEGQFEGLLNKIGDDNDADLERVWNMQRSYTSLGYALVDDNRTLIPLGRLRDLAHRASVYMEQHASYGASLFFPQVWRGHEPQIRSDTLDNTQVSFIEGTRLDNDSQFATDNDYWRIYDRGLAIAIDPHIEDSDGRTTSSGTPYLDVYWVLVRFHSILIHARFLAGDVGTANQIIIMADWKGLEGRSLLWDRRHERVAGSKILTDRYVYNTTIPWSLLRDDYFVAFRQVALPFLELFPPVSRPADQWLTEDFVRQQFSLSEFGGLKFPD